MKFLSSLVLDGVVLPSSDPVYNMQFSHLLLEEQVMGVTRRASGQLKFGTSFDLS